MLTRASNAEVVKLEDYLADFSNSKEMDYSNKEYVNEILKELVKTRQKLRNAEYEVKDLKNKFRFLQSNK